MSPSVVGAHPRSRGENVRPRPASVYLGGSSPLTRGKRAAVNASVIVTGLIPAHAGKTPWATYPTSVWPAHPRSRGENDTPFARAVTHAGSSPLTRGKRHCRRHGQGGNGLIPAHAGKTRHTWRSWAGRAAHPRSRGENDERYIPLIHERGSSPLTRGKRARGADHAKRGRLIPAHAGKTPTTAAGFRPLKAHPRSRGENSDPAYGRALSLGSSPLTRGKHVHVVATLQLRGLIPAHAGKTSYPSMLKDRLRAHPRSRGENPDGAPHPVGDGGSSPLTRGKHFMEAGRLPSGGLIPAHAGKTNMDLTTVTRRQAHPRSRGENQCSNLIFCARSGSSPLTRGKQATVLVDGLDHGLIPAHAGKTADFYSQSERRRAHPRSRGENASRSAKASLTAGSSPLTRGKPSRLLPWLLSVGLIPAHAGKTL